MQWMQSLVCVLYTSNSSLLVTAAGICALSFVLVLVIVLVLVLMNGTSPPAYFDNQFC
jgi:hypothetical protein